MDNTWVALAGWDNTTKFSQLANLANNGVLVID